MKNNLLKIGYIVCYILALLLLLTFIIFCIMGYQEYKELPIKYPNVAVLPFSSWLMGYAKSFLVPSALFVVLGIILQCVNRKTIKGLMKIKDILFPKEVKPFRLFGFRIFSIGNLGKLWTKKKNLLRKVKR